MSIDKLELIISLASASVGLLVTTVIFLVKFVDAIKNRNYAVAQKLLKEGAIRAVALAEQLKGKTTGTLDGATKKSFAMSEMKAFCADNKIKYNEEEVSKLIEEIVDLTKQVNSAKPSDKTYTINGSSAK